MIREIKAYSFGNDESPVKKDDHSMDELRYYLMNKQAEFQVKKQQSDTLKYKQKLINNLKREKYGYFG